MGIARARAVMTGDEPPPDVLVTGFDGSRVSLDVRFWHPPQLSAEKATRDGVARAVVDLLQTPELALADPAIIVRQPAAADHEGERS